MVQAVINPSENFGTTAKLTKSRKRKPTDDLTQRKDNNSLAAGKRVLKAWNDLSEIPDVNSVIPSPPETIANAQVPEIQQLHLNSVDSFAVSRLVRISPEALQESIDRATARTKHDPRYGLNEWLVPKAMPRSLPPTFTASTAPLAVLKSIQLQLTDPEVLRQHAVVKITQGTLFKKHVPNPGGANDPRMGAFNRHLSCKSCGETQCCQGHIGLIELEYPVFNPLLETHIRKVARAVCYRCSRILLSRHDQRMRIVERAAPEMRLTLLAKFGKTISYCGYCPSPPYEQHAPPATLSLDQANVDPEAVLAQIRQRGCGFKQPIYPPLAAVKDRLRFHCLYDPDSLPTHRGEDSDVLAQANVVDSDVDGDGSSTTITAKRGSSSSGKGGGRGKGRAKLAKTVHRRKRRRRAVCSDDEDGGGGGNDEDDCDMGGGSEDGGADTDMDNDVEPEEDDNESSMHQADEDNDESGHGDGDGDGDEVEEEEDPDDGVLEDDENGATVEDEEDEEDVDLDDAVDADLSESEQHDDQSQVGSESEMELGPLGEDAISSDEDDEMGAVGEDQDIDDSASVVPESSSSPHARISGSSKRKRDGTVQSKTQIPSTEPRDQDEIPSDDEEEAETSEPAKTRDVSPAPPPPRRLGRLPKMMPSKDESTMTMEMPGFSNKVMYDILRAIHPDDVALMGLKSHPKLMFITALPAPPNQLNPNSAFDGSSKTRGECDLIRAINAIVKVNLQIIKAKAEVRQQMSAAERASLSAVPTAIEASGAASRASLHAPGLGVGHVNTHAATSENADRVSDDNQSHIASATTAPTLAAQRPHVSVKQQQEDEREIEQGAAALHVEEEFHPCEDEDIDFGAINNNKITPLLSRLQFEVRIKNKNLPMPFERSTRGMHHVGTR